MKETKVSSSVRFNNFFMTVYEDTVKLDNGKHTTRTYIKHDGAAAVLPITVDHKLILIKQFRYPVGQVFIEVPAGKKDAIDEAGLTCAKRELEEETGYQSNAFEFIGTTHNCIGYSNEAIDLYIARNCQLVDNPLKADDDENIDLMIVSLEEAKELLSSHQITDAKTWILIQHYISEMRD